MKQLRRISLTLSMLLALVVLGNVAAGCRPRKKNAGEKIGEAIEDAGDAVEDASH